MQMLLSSTATVTSIKNTGYDAMMHYIGSFDEYTGTSVQNVSAIVATDAVSRIHIAYWAASFCSDHEAGPC